MFAPPFRTTSTQCLFIDLVPPSNPMVPLLVPGAELAAAALRVYAGPHGKHIKWVVLVVVDPVSAESACMSQGGGRPAPQDWP